jgi:hypothetical protein
MTKPGTSLPNRHLDYLTVRFLERLPTALRKLLLLRALLRRGVWLRALLGGLLAAQLRLGLAGASGPVLTPWLSLM